MVDDQERDCGPDCTKRVDRHVEHRGRKKRCEEGVKERSRSQHRAPAPPLLWRKKTHCRGCDRGSRGAPGSGCDRVSNHARFLLRTDSLIQGRHGTIPRSMAVHAASRSLLVGCQATLPCLQGSPVRYRHPAEVLDQNNLSCLEYLLLEILRVPKSQGVSVDE
jgi:hypothetical protein